MPCLACPAPWDTPDSFCGNMYSQQDAGPSKRMWLGENRRTSVLFPEEKGAIAHMSPHTHIQGQGSTGVSGDVPLQSQSPGHQDGDRDKTVAELIKKTPWREGSKGEEGEPGVSQSHSTPRAHQSGSYIFACQRRRGTSLKQAEASSCQMQPALHMMQRDAGDLGGPRVTLQELWAQSCW